MRAIKNKIFLVVFTFVLTVAVHGLLAEETAKNTPAEVKPQAEPASSEKPKDAVATAAIPAQESEAEEEALDESVKIEPGNVTVNFKGADIKTVLSYISEVAGIDIVAAPDVKGIIDLKLSNKPWKVALDIIVRNYGFAYEREGDIIRVVTIDKLKQEEVTTQAFKVNYGKAKDIVSSVEDIVGDRGSVMHDDRTNMVIVTDIPTNVYKIGQIVQRLDKETSQVLIEARVLETVLGDSEKLGIDWNIKITASGAKRPITAPFNYYGADSRLIENFYPLTQSGTTNTVTTTTGASGANTTPPYPIDALGTVGTPGTAGSKGFPYIDYTQDIFKDTFTFGTLDFSQFKAVLEMIKSRSDTNIVSNPRIATLNNNPANIIVGQTINLPKYERNSTTGKMEISGYDAKDLGIKLKVVPHINEKDEIVVELAPEISDFVRYDTLDASSGIVAPVFSSRQANTKVMIRDGDTIFIGGMIKENIIDSKKKLPFVGDLLGDVPYLGLLFTKKDKIRQKVELIFFITVRLMKPGQELSEVPNPEKAYKPTYELSQDKKRVLSKKRKIK
ncbi:MAG: secretin N-terminal domain-containing protein [Candidatus Omnitrophota bacterium]|nr:secretin N-terminal domain-containing protein [Candidatus Omnitrophota bacterium]